MSPKFLRSGPSIDLLRSPPGRVGFRHLVTQNEDQLNFLLLYGIFISKIITIYNYYKYFAFSICSSKLERVHSIE